MKYPAPKFKVGDRLTVDDWMTVKVAKAQLIKKAGKVFWNYQLTNTGLFDGFWAEESRLKEIKK